jgi:hypothetical protein
MPKAWAHVTISCSSEDDSPEIYEDDSPTILLPIEGALQTYA